MGSQDRGGVEPAQNLDSPCRLDGLPTELCYLVLELLSWESGRALSRCSRFWYHFIFRLRVRGIRFRSSCYDEPARQSAVLRSFGDGGCFAALRRYIRCLRFEGDAILNLPLWLDLLSDFTDVTSIITRTYKPRGAEKNLYFAILSHLSVLPYYHSIQHIDFEWETLSDVDLGHRPSDSDISESEPEGADFSDIEISDEEGPYQRLEAVERNTRDRDSFLSHLEFKLWCGGSFIGRYISNRAFKKLINGEFFPRNLRYLKLHMSENRYYTSLFYLPLIRSETITALNISGWWWSKNPVRDPEQPDQMLEFPTIKALSLYFQNVGYSEDIRLGYIPEQFPNLVSLIVVRDLYFDAWDRLQLLLDLPNIKNLEYLVLPWVRGRNSSQNTASMEESLRERLEDGDFPALRTLKLSVRTYGVCFSFGEATCMISRLSHPGGEKEELKLEWVEDCDVAGVKTTYLDEIWNSGVLTRGMEPLSGEIADDMRKIEMDESLYESEEERIKMDGRVKARDTRKRWKKWKWNKERRREARERLWRERVRKEDDRLEGLYVSTSEEEEEEELPGWAIARRNGEIALGGEGEEESEVEEKEGEEADDEIGHTASQCPSFPDETEIYPEDSDEYEDMETNENDTQETNENGTQEMFDSFRDPQFDVSVSKPRYEEEDNAQYESQDSQFDTQEYLDNHIGMAQEPQPKPEKSVNLTMDPREVEMVRNKNLYRR
ncbi:hypothetical protein TWF281_004757 [Arthrobotrys megalospora]